MALERPKSLRELALEHLRNSIIDGSLKMGQVLSERKISEELGVSKSPVREALAQLRDVMKETQSYGFAKVKQEQQELGQQVRSLLESRGFKSVAAQLPSHLYCPY